MSTNGVGYVDGFGDLTPVPGYRQYPRFLPREILASYARFTQKGCTLAGGQGVLLAGTVVARRTSDKKYLVYAPNASDGTQNPKGILRDDVDTGVTTGGPGPRDMLANVVLSGIVKYSYLSGLDANAVTVLNGRTDVDRDWFIF